MKILYLHQYFVTPSMAGGTRSYEMARRLVARGHEVDLLTTERSPQGTGKGWRTTLESGIRVHWTPVPYDQSLSFRGRIEAFLVFAARASRKVMTFRPDVVFATSTPLTIAIPAILAKRRLGCPMVFEVRDLWPSAPIALGLLTNPMTKRAALWLEGEAYRQAARVVALAPGMREHVIARGKPPERVVVIPNGCDLELFTPDPEPGRKLRQSLPWLKSNPLVLFTGALGRANGVDHLIRLAGAMLKTAPEVRFVIIGGGSERGALEALARDLGVLEVNLFMLGPKPKLELPQWLSAADITTAYFKGPPAVWKDAVQNKFFDSISAGKPVAANHRGWQTQLALEAGCGIVMDPDDPDHAAIQLREMLTDRNWLTRAGKAARRLAEESFDRDRLALDLDKVLLEVVHGAGGVKASPA